MARKKKDEPIMLLGRVPCCGYDCSTGTAYVPLTDEVIKKIGDRYLELLQMDIDIRGNQNETNK